jgi:hypothetical protein
MRIIQYASIIVPFLIIAAIGDIRTSLLVGSRGYKVTGLGVFFCALAILLLRYRIAISIAGPLLLISFVAIQVGFGILMTKEKYIADILRTKRNFYQRLLGIVPEEVLQMIKEKGGDKPTVENRNEITTILVGIFSIMIGVITFLLKNEMIYSAILVVCGLIFVFMGLCYGRR